MIGWVALAGGVGACMRWVVTAWFAGRSRLGTGTALVNSFGALGLGLVVGLDRADRIGAQVAVVVGVGLLGSLTTFSTWMVETAEASERRPGAAVGRTAPLIAVGMALAWLGLTVGSFK
jgi:CrcB protein